MSKKKKKFDPVPDELIANALVDETDRGCVLVAAAFIDFWLAELARELFSQACGKRKANQELIKRVLAEGGDSLFGSLWARNTVLHLIGLIDDEFHDLIDEFRSLRNLFAHWPGKVTLDDAAIESAVAKLTSEEHLIRMQEFEKWYEAKDDRSPLRHLGATESFSAARVKFMHLCFVIYLYLGEKWFQLDPARPPNGVRIAFQRPKSRSQDESVPPQDV